MPDERTLWEYLTETGKPIFLYGTGNGADKILDVLERYGVSLSGIFASDGFVRERTFRGFPVRSYSDVLAEYGNEIVVLLAFGTTLPEVRQFIELLNERHELRIPDVPLYGGALFDRAYANENAKLLAQARELLADEESRELFDDAVRFRLYGKPEDLLRTEEAEVTLASLLRDQKLRNVLDCGAFRGDSTELFARTLHPEAVYAVEADPRTYRKLCKYAEAETRCRVIPVHAALAGSDGEMKYVSSASRGSGETGRNRRAKVETVPCRSLDSLLSDKPVDLIKLDIEGSERAALVGGMSCICRDRPNLAVSLYHRTDDLYELPILIHELLPEHRLYLRRVPCIPMWDLTLYAVRQKEGPVAN